MVSEWTGLPDGVDGFELSQGLVIPLRKNVPLLINTAEYGMN